MARRRMMNETPAQAAEEQQVPLPTGPRGPVAEPQDSRAELDKVEEDLAVQNGETRQQARDRIESGNGPTIVNPHVSVPMNGLVYGETVSATWGEEQFSPKQFHSFRVGPFSATTRLRQGETRQQALERLNAELREFAEAEKRRKYEGYMKSVAEMGGGR